MQTFCGLTTDGMLEYLASIYQIYQADGRVSTGLLAERMCVSAAAASSMLKRLEEGGFVERSDADGVVLTQQGTLAALQLIRRHRLLEVFLIDVMGFTWDQVESEARRLQHAVSSAFTERMDALCGYPQRCPHGDPIPTKEGDIAREDLVPLAEIEEGRVVEIRRVTSRDPRVLRYLDQLGLRPGRTVHLLQKAPFNGPLSLRLAGAETSAQEAEPPQILGYELARVLHAAPAPRVDSFPDALHSMEAAVGH